MCIRDRSSANRTLRSSGRPRIVPTVYVTRRRRLKSWARTKSCQPSQETQQPIFQIAFAIRGAFQICPAENRKPPFRIAQIVVASRKIALRVAIRNGPRSVSGRFRRLTEPSLLASFWRLRGEGSSEEKAEQMRKKYSEGVTAISRWFERSEHHRYRIELDFAPRKGASNRRALKQRLT